MLRWRLTLGILIVATLAALFWLDHQAEVVWAARMPGLFLLPVAILIAVTCSHEVLHLAEAGGLHPLAWPVYVGNLLLVFANWAPRVAGGCESGEPQRLVVAGAWPAWALALGLLLVLLGEIRRFRGPNGATANIGAAVFALAYVGVLLSFLIQLRMAWGVGAVVSLVVVVKLGDTGAYTLGRLIGRHKLAPVVSPGKTIEGAIGGLLCAVVGSWGTFAWLVPLAAVSDSVPGPWWGWLVFGLLVGLTGLVGDLAESLLKRDVGRKDSSHWLPGFGGVLDIFDSILLSAPVAWLCWALGVVG